MTMSSPAQAKPEHMRIAETIVSQLGGNRFVAMTGAKHFMGLPADASLQSMGGVHFKLPRGLAVNGINCVRITLNASDTYTVEALKISAKSYSVTEVAKAEMVYCDMLEEVFTDMTGLVTRL